MNVIDKKPRGAGWLKNSNHLIFGNNYKDTHPNKSKNYFLAARCHVCLVNSLC